MSGEWRVPSLWRPDESEEITIIDVDPVEAFPDDPTEPCRSLRDILAQAAGPEHEEDLVRYLVLERFDR